MSAASFAATYSAGDIAPRGAPDGQLNAGDILLLQQLVLGQITATPEEQLAADVAPLAAPDGSLNAGDLVVLMRAVQGQITLPPLVPPPPPPQLEPATSPTQSNPQSIIGTSPSGSEVRLYVNGALQTVTTVSATDGAFNFSAVLQDGVNTLYATTWDGQKESAPSNTLNVEYQNNINRNQTNATLAANTVWTAGTVPEPYIITDTLTIATGVTLTIQPGTTLLFAPNARLVVDGDLVVEGTAASQVVFTSSNTRNPHPGDWQGIVVNASTTRVTLDHSLIEWASTGIDVTGATLELRNSTIRNFKGSGLSLQLDSSSVINGNLIELGNTGYFSPAIYLYNASPTISGNTLRSNIYGIYVDIASQPVIGNGNTITANDYGIYVMGDYSSASSNPNPTVSGNSIYNNKNYNYYVSGIVNIQSVELDASHNWWGDVDPSVFLKKIFSYKDDWGNSSARVRITPFLDAPNGNQVAGNYLSGALSGNTVLQAGTPYEVIGTLLVLPDAMLTLEPGATLHFASTSGLFVRGGLSAIGTPTQPITLSSASSTPVKGDWNGIVAGDYVGSTVYNNGITIQHTIIDSAVDGIQTFGGTLRATDNRITNFSRSAVYVGELSTGTISNNTINGPADSLSIGINGYAAGTFLISGNDIQNTETGIYVLNYSPDISGNQIKNNTYGIQIVKRNAAEISNPLIHNGNQITNNSIGINVSGMSSATSGAINPVVTGNSIFNNLTYNVQVTGADVGVSSILDATGNWWGTVQATDIVPTICDFTKSQAGCFSVVNFSPYLDGPGGKSVYSNLLYGLIATDTVFSGDTIHDIDGSLYVADGVTLTIEPGAVLRFPANASLVLHGNATIQGTPDKLITFTSTASSPAKGDWTGVFIVGNGTTLINYAVFEHAGTGLSVHGDNLTVTGAVFNNNTYGVRFTGRQIALTESSFNANSLGIQLSSLFSNAYGPLLEGNVSDNRFDNNLTALELNSVGSPLISGNRIQNGSAGIRINGEGSPNVTLNLIENNDYGIYLQSAYRPVTSRYYDPAPVVSDNNIQNNSIYSYYTGRFFSDPQVQLDATSNWWGSTIQSDIDTMIYDAADRTDSPTVNILPLAILPVQLAPELNGAPNNLTNTNPYTVSGMASSSFNVNLYVNGALQSTSVADTSGGFSIPATLAEGANTLYVTTERSGAESPPSPAITVNLDTVAPTITVNSPIDGMVTTLSEQVVTGTIDTAATLTVNGASVPLATDNSFSYSSLSLSEGPNVITLVAIDPAGNSTQTTINLTLDTTPPAAPDMGKIAVGDSSNGLVAVSGTAGSVDASALLFIVNARTGQAQPLSVAADGSFSGTVKALPGDALSIVVSDTQGNAAPWGTATANGAPQALAVTVQQPADGAQVNSDTVSVIGTLQGPVNTGVRVNGVVARQYNDQFVASNVALVPGSNNLTVMATTRDGGTATQTLTVTRGATPNITSAITPTNGIGPLNVTFSIQSATLGNIQAVEIDVDGDGNADLSGSDINYTWALSSSGAPVIASASAQYTYTTAGIYKSNVRVTNSSGGLENTTHIVTVQNLMGIDARLRAVYNGMRSQLKAGDINGALSALTQGVQGKYQRVFTGLTPNLASIVDQLGVIRGGRISSDYAEYIIVRGSGAQAKAFLIYLVRGEDGIWRLESM